MTAPVPLWRRCHVCTYVQLCPVCVPRSRTRLSPAQIDRALGRAREVLTAKPSVLAAKPSVLAAKPSVLAAKPSVLAQGSDVR